MPEKKALKSPEKTSEPVIPYRKLLRNKMVTGMLNYMRGSGLPDKLNGFLLKSLHFHIPWYFLLLFILLPLDMAIYALIPLLISLGFFLYLRGCFLTIVEYKLCHDDTNIIDPYIIACDEEINNESRYRYTLGVASIYFIIVALILTVRYIHK